MSRSSTSPLRTRAPSSSNDPEAAAAQPNSMMARTSSQSQSSVGASADASCLPNVGPCGTAAAMASMNRRPRRILSSSGAGGGSLSGRGNNRLCSYQSKKKKKQIVLLVQKPRTQTPLISQLFLLLAQVVVLLGLLYLGSRIN